MENNLASYETDFFMSTITHMERPSSVRLLATCFATSLRMGFFYGRCSMGVRETSLIAFQEERKNINTSEARVLDVIENANHPMNISLVADALGMEKSSISGRINALVKKGLIFSVGKYKCPMTGKSTLFYISGRGIDEQMELMFN